jgi:hypothetical protein
MTFARGCREHGDVLADSVGCDQRALVAGDGAHRGQSVHRLRRAGAWNSLVREDRHARFGELLDELRLLRPVQETDKDLALAQETDLILRRALYLDYYVGFAVDAIWAVYDLCPRFLVARVEVVVAPRARLHEDLETILDEPAYGLGHEPDPALALGHLPRNPYFHAPDYSVGAGSALPRASRYQQNSVL